MGRKVTTKAVRIAGSAELSEVLEEISSWGMYGKTPAEVGRTLLTRGIEVVLEQNGKTIPQVLEDRRRKKP